MGRSSVSSNLIDFVVHAGLIGIVLVNLGFIASSCTLDRERNSPGDDDHAPEDDEVDRINQALVVPTTSDVGTIEGNFSVGPTGAGSYVIRLWTPQGRSDMTPRLTLSYSSGAAADAHVGVGWSLSGGLSMIHRCTKNSRRHSRPAPVSFINSAAEQYCLDGQPLVLVGGGNGQAGAEYRTEPETFSRIVIDQVLDAQPAQFTVFSRDGRIHTYGTNVAAGGTFEDPTLLIRGNRDQWGLTDNPGRDDSNVENSPSNSATYGWLRGSVRDRFPIPNHIWFRYSHPADRAGPGAAQEPLLTAIEYVDINGFRSRQIRFSYGPMPDVNSQRHEYIAGMPFKVTQRLQSIDMLVAGPGSTTFQSVKLYRFFHSTSPSTSRMRLDGVQECDGNQAFVTGRTVVCKKATAFTYSPGTSSFSDIPTGITDLRQPVDSQFWGIQVADIDHDGRDDIVYRATPPGGGPRRWYYRKAVAGGFGVPIDTQLQASDIPGDAVLADFARADGVQGIDGAPDIGVPAGVNRYAFYRNDGAGNFSLAFTEPPGEAAPNLGLQVADLSGKGQVTILRPIVNQNNWAYRFFAGSAMTPLSGPMGCLWNEAFDQDGWNGQVGDVDGDGATDFLTIRAGATDYLSRMLQSAVPAPPPSPGEPPPEGVWDYDDTNLLASRSGDLVKYYFFDLNGDTLADALRLRQGQNVPRLVVNSGNGFQRPLALSHLSGTEGNVELGPTTAFRDLIDPGIRVMDYDSDGKQDLLLVDDGVIRDSGAQPLVPRRTQMVVLLSRNGTLQPAPAGVPLGAPADGHAAIDPVSPSIHNYRQTQVLDVNGDGLHDIVAVSPNDNQLHLYVRQGIKPDLLVGVRDGMGAKTDVNYLPMIDPSVSTPGDACAFPRICAKRGPWLAQSFRVDNGIGAAQNEFRFFYEGSRFDVQGGGNLGFRRRIHTDVAASTTIDETYDQESTATIRSLDEGEPDVQVYSKLGLPIARVIETTDPAFTRRMAIDYVYEFVTTNNRLSYYARPTLTGTVIEEASPPGTPAAVLSSRTEVSTYDPQFNDFGIVSGIRTTSSTPQGEFVDEWSSSYQNLPDVWLLGLMTERILRSRAPGQAEVARKVRLQPDPNSGAVNSLEVEPDDTTNDMYLFVEFVRNARGQIWIHRRSDHLTNQRTDTILYDAQSVHAQTHTNALNHVTTFDVDPGLGVVHSVRDPNNAATRFDYDAFGRVRRIRYPGGGGRTLSYARVPDPASTPEDPRDQLRVTTIDDGGGQLIQYLNFINQERRRERRNLDGSLSFVDLDYNDLGLPSGTSRPAPVGQPRGPTTVRTYDELGRPLREERPEDSFDEADAPTSTSVLTYSYEKLLQTASDEFGRLSRFTEDGLGRVVKSESRNDAGQWLPTEYSYGPFGVLRLVVRRDGGATESRITEVVHDTLGRRTSLNDPDTGMRRFAYNAFGEVRQETDAEGSTITYARDALGRITQKVDKDGTTTFTWDTAVNGKGRLAETNSPFGVRRRFFYDTFGRTSREIWTMVGQTFQFDYVYDSNGRVQKVRYPTTTGFARFTVANTFDADSGELAKVHQDGSSTVYWELNATETDGQIKRETFGNAVRTDYGYSEITGRINSITSTKGTNTLRRWGYDYWSDGNLRRRSDLLASEHERFEYDELDRIRTWMAADVAGNPFSGGWTVNYTIDDFGNLTRRHFVAGPVTGGTSQDLTFTMFPGTNRIQTAPWGGFGYDASGNQTTRPEGESVSYTAFELPKQITGPRSATFLYDAFGIRAKKRQDDTHYALYVTDLYEKRVNGSTIDHVMYVQARGKVVAQVMRRQGGGETVKYLHPDRLGSVDSVTDANGSVVEQTKRDPFGNRVVNFNTPTLPFSIVGTTNKVRLGFTGQEQDDELGLINMRGRVYDPRLARFLTTDPIVGRPLLGQSFNRYAYVLNNPTRSVDPTGFQPETDDCVLFPNDPACAPKPHTPPDEPPEPGHQWVERPPGSNQWVQECVSEVCATSIVIPADPPQPPPPPPPITNPANSGTGIIVGEPPGSSSGGGGGSGGPSSGGNQGPGSQSPAEPGMMGAATMTMPTPMAPPMVRPMTTPQPGFVGRAAAAVVGALGRAVAAIGAGAAAAGAAVLVFLLPRTAEAPTLSTGLRNENRGEGKTLQPGPHAGESIEARGPERDFTPAERDKIDEIGAETGCHTCGTTDPGTKSGRFVPDHQPPTAISEPGTPQRLYPHCINCSRVQGGEVNAARR
jgi:RHS repeat-associated protein